MTEQDWNPEKPDQLVRVKNNPGKRGKTTGEVKRSAGRLLVLVNFGPNEKAWKQYEQLEIFQEIESIEDLFKKGSFGKPDDLRRILTFEKIKGELTDIFYSMESSNTDFHAYQFKPVLKFLDSPVGRLLIADEVGLGKTIESIYIWKELQAREEARRLLIVCPAILRDKWVNDLQERFNLSPEVIDAKGLLTKVDELVNKRNRNSFIYVTSLEGIRVKNWKEQENSDVKAKLARLMDENPADNEFSIFDLVIIDEAHYLRNPDTANHKLGNLLRETSKYLILLTATPIQLGSQNLYQLLKLVSPEDFFESWTFEQMLKDNRPISDALKLIWKKDVDREKLKELISDALKSKYFHKSERLKHLNQVLNNINTINSTQQVEFAKVLESSSLFGQFMTRSRKREVMKNNRVKRRPQTLIVNFTKEEKEIYDYITYKIRCQALGESKFNVFRLMARQRQMASCIVAALEAWRDKGVLDDFLAIDDNEEELYEIYGSQLDDEVNTYKTYAKTQINWEIPPNPIPPNEEELDDFIEKLKNNDTKYQELISFIKEEISKNPQEKFVLFAFFRNTLFYLLDRLRQEEIQIGTYIIVGGMTRDEKNQTLQNFQETNQGSILLSSEVGSEGIDLQFCRFLINYDLPWNPMRVEQRIGRLDRLNQKSAAISIINFSLKNTIEEYILEKLYERIKIFEESIGDLEEILGEKTEELILDLLKPNLNEQELKEEAERAIIAITNDIEQQRTLENEAMNIMGFSDYILNTIDTSRKRGRWLHPEERQAFIEDFFKYQYPGTVITPNKTNKKLFEISLSEEAKIDLRLFYNSLQLPIQTQLIRKSVNCFFDPKIVPEMGKYNYDLIDTTHPLIQWIRHKYESESSIKQNLSAVKLSLSGTNIDIKIGTYIYVVQRWNFKGLRGEARLAYKVICLENQQALENDKAEILVNEAAIKSEYKPNVVNLLDFEKVIKIYEQCEEALREAFAVHEIRFEAENDDKCNAQANSIKASATRKWEELDQRRQKLKDEGKLTPLRLIDGQMTKNKENLNVAMKKIEERRKIDTSNPTLASGIIFVEN